MLRQFFGALFGVGKKPAPVTPERPGIGWLSVAYIRCPVCTKPLMDGQLVIQYSRDMTHAECVVVLKNDDGTMPADVALNARSVVMTRQEWEYWRSSANDIEHKS